MPMCLQVCGRGRIRRQVPRAAAASAVGGALARVGRATACLGAGAPRSRHASEFTEWSPARPSRLTTAARVSSQKSFISCHNKAPRHLCAVAAAIVTGGAWLSDARSRKPYPLTPQVQLAIREGRGAGGAQRPAAENGAAGGAGPGRRDHPAGNSALPALPEGAEAALLYVRFRAAAEPSLKGKLRQLNRRIRSRLSWAAVDISVACDRRHTRGCWHTAGLTYSSVCRTAPLDAGLLSGVASRAKAPEYSRLLADCRGLYCETRVALVGPVTRSRVAALAGQPLSTLTRSGCAYLMQVPWCQGSLLLHVNVNSLAGRFPSAAVLPPVTFRF